MHGLFGHLHAQLLVWFIYEWRWIKLSSQPSAMVTKILRRHTKHVGALLALDVAPPLYTEFATQSKCKDLCKIEFFYYCWMRGESILPKEICGSLSANGCTYKSQFVMWPDQWFIITFVMCCLQRNFKKNFKVQSNPSNRVLELTEDHLTVLTSGLWVHHNLSIWLPKL